MCGLLGESSSDQIIFDRVHIYFPDSQTGGLTSHPEADSSGSSVELVVFIYSSVIEVG